MFFILRLFLFKDFLNERYNNPEEKSQHIIEQLTH